MISTKLNAWIAKWFEMLATLWNIFCLQCVQSYVNKIEEFEVKLEVKNLANLHNVEEASSLNAILGRKSWKKKINLNPFHHSLLIRHKSREVMCLIVPIVIQTCQFVPKTDNTWNNDCKYFNLSCYFYF